MIRRPPRSTLFPTRRSSDLVDCRDRCLQSCVVGVLLRESDCRRAVLFARDRKSTRLNSSHLVISYAVFCLKKKKKTVSYELRVSTSLTRHPCDVTHSLLLRF